MGYLSFTDTNHTLLQSAAATESDIPHPTTDYDVRLDVDLKTLVAGRNVAGAHNDSSASREVNWSLQTGDLAEVHPNNDTVWQPTGAYWVTGRWQYRFLWSGTTWTLYDRDPADGRSLSDATGWSTHATTTKNNVSGLTDNANTPFTLMRRYTGAGWAAADWYEVYIAIDGTVASSWRGGSVTLNLGANTFTDDQAQTWTWTGSDPTQVPDGTFAASLLASNQGLRTPNRNLLLSERKV